MAKTPAVADDDLVRVLSTYAGLVAHVLNDPGRWLGLDEDPPPTAALPLRLLDAVRDRVFGDTTPASPQWAQRPVQQRVDWWVTRIGVSAGLAAAAPRLAGALADRLPLQAALGASASGLAVCATAREHGVVDPQAWVPLLARVLFDRRVEPEEAAVPAAAEAERELDDAPAGADEQSGGGVKALGRGAQRAAATLWRLARAMVSLAGLLDERPRGGLVARMVAKLPVVGIAGGWLDERGAIRRAAQATAGLVG